MIGKEPDRYHLDANRHLYLHLASLNFDRGTIRWGFGINLFIHNFEFMELLEVKYLVINILERSVDFRCRLTIQGELFCYGHCRSNEIEYVNSEVASNNCIKYHYYFS